MIKIVTGIMILGVLLQSPTSNRKSERETEGFVGPVKNAIVEWMPVSGYPNLPNTKLPYHIYVYDREGRRIRYSYFSGALSGDEHREEYTYDKDGNRTTRDEFIQGKNSPPPPPPPMMPPGAAVKGPPKTTFKYDGQGMMIEKANLRGNGDLIYKTTYKYDEIGRVQETNIIHATGQHYRWVYKYEGKKRFPESEDSLDGKSNTTRYTIIYSDYEFNPQGDWIKRKRTLNESTGKTTVEIQYQTIEYFPAAK